MKSSPAKSFDEVEVINQAAPVRKNSKMAYVLMAIFALMIAALAVSGWMISLIMQATGPGSSAGWLLFPLFFVTLPLSALMAAIYFVGMIVLLVRKKLVGGLKLFALITLAIVGLVLLAIVPAIAVFLALIS